MLLAGHSGRWIADQLDRESIGAGIAWGADETRTCVSILDPHTGAMTEVYEAGEPISQSQWEAFERMVDQSLATANTFALGAGVFDPSSAVEVSKQVRILRWES